jgi:hypothetical protein
MDVISSAVNSLVGILSPYFIVASFLPALGFLLVAYIVIGPMVVGNEPYQSILQFDLKSWLIIGGIAVAIGYAMAALNNSLILLFQGRYFANTRLGRFLIVRAVQRFEWIDREVGRLEKTVRQLQDEIDFDKLTLSPFHWKDADFRRKYHRCLSLWAEQLKLVNELVKYYPPEKDSILPTRFGNVFSAFEGYLRYRYGLDYSALWPHFRSVLASSDAGHYIDRQKMGLDFFLNISVLSAIIAMGYIAANLYFNARISFEIPVACMVISWISYRFSVIAALSYGATVRATADLHRDKLRAALALRVPGDFGGETVLWEQVSQFVQPTKYSPSIPPFLYPPVTSSLPANKDDSLKQKEVCKDNPNE